MSPSALNSATPLDRLAGGPERVLHILVGRLGVEVGPELIAELDNAVADHPRTGELGSIVEQPRGRLTDVSVDQNLEVMR
jgi:hypothetical protein